MSETLPTYFLASIAQQYDPLTVKAIRQGSMMPRTVSLRANTLKTTPHAIATALAAQGIAFDHLPFSDCAFSLPIAREAAVRALPAYRAGEIYLQSLSSMLPPIALSPKEGTDILDMAAAPGGKTAQIAALCANRSAITACEIDKIRAEKLRYNLDLQGVTRVNVMVCDARKLESFFRFDQILLDAPCSGSGTLLSCDPASTRAFSKKLVKNSASLQLQLLKKALSLLKPGGSMVYSTCSILRAENEDVVQSALKGADAFLEPIIFPGMEALPLLPCTLPGALCIAPTPQYEGFFMARLRKKK